MNIGDKISFGKHKAIQNMTPNATEQIGRVLWNYDYKIYTTNGTPIEWIVLDIIGDIALVISKDVICDRWFHDHLISSVTWKSSEIRSWLNYFFTSCFSQHERDTMINARITSNNEVSFDKIFLLSKSEWIKYQSRIPSCEEVNWTVFYLRDKDGNYGVNVAPCQKGSDVPSSVSMDIVAEIRPAMWIRI